MHSTNQQRGPDGSIQQQRAPEIVQQTTSLNACSKSIGKQSSQSQGALISVSFNARSAPEVFGCYNWPQPPVLSLDDDARPTDQGRSLSGAYQEDGSQRFDVNGNSSHAPADVHVGLNLQYQYAAPQKSFGFAKRQQPLQLPSFWQSTEMEDFQQSPRSGLPHECEVDHDRDPCGLLTPVSINAQTSPFEGLGSRNDQNFGGYGQQVWEHNVDATFRGHAASNPFAADLSLNDLAAPAEAQPWEGIDFGSLDGLFGVHNSKTFDHFGGSFNSAAPRQDMHFPSHPRESIPNAIPGQFFDTFLAQLKTSDRGVDGISSKAGQAQQILHPPFAEQRAVRNTAPTIPGLSDALNTPSPAESAAWTPIRGSRKTDAKNALLIEWKEQGMSYKDIKAHGGFEEAESTLRGRYRTLTKPKEKRVRRPEWSERDVSSIHMNWQQCRDSQSKVELLFAAVDHFTTASQLSQQRCSNRVAFERRRAEPKIPWKQVTEYMADRGCYKYGYSTVRRKYDEVREARKRV